MPRTAEQLERLRRRRREQILESAVDLFARHGFEGTSVRMIADAADVSAGLLYNYFESKDDVLRAIFRRSMEDVQESFARAAVGDTPAERVRRLVRAALDVVLEHLSFWRLTYAVRMQPAVMESLDDRVAAWMEAIRRDLEHRLREVGSDAPALDARVLFAAIDGAAQHYAMDPAEYPVDEVAEALARRFLPVAEGGGAGSRAEEGS